MLPRRMARNGAEWPIAARNAGRFSLPDFDRRFVRRRRNVAHREGVAERRIRSTAIVRR